MKQALGHLAIDFFEISRCWYNTDMILANVGIESLKIDLQEMLADAETGNRW
jgi:hypothetical protein